MLERYFARPQTVDRIHASWLGPAIEQCATWLIARGHAAKNLARYVPIEMHFAGSPGARRDTLRRSPRACRFIRQRLDRPARPPPRSWGSATTLDAGNPLAHRADAAIGGARICWPHASSSAP